MIQSKNFQRLMMWLEQHDGEFIESDRNNWRENYLQLKEATQDELNEICWVWNELFQSKYCLANSKGEIYIMEVAKHD